MKKTYILFFSTLLILMATICFAKDLNKEKERHQRMTIRFIEILNEQWGVNKENLSGESLYLKDFGADSVDINELFMAIEEDFDIEIPYEDRDQITTIHSAVDLIIKIIDKPAYGFWQ
ncbi:MAG: phosphopantetheine-binding protein [Desulfobacterales bacterium]|nr:phosphopantetheine-binding protein [Desulfobacterales bacterium]